ncbi:MAG: ATP-binding protein, partial [Proteobacteria bacterium]|nr:ATP-binding protein [Pseudomonadota bacterium]
NFDGLSLLLGPNGGGKSTLFDLLYNIRHLLVNNARVGDIFLPGDRTAWMDKTDQSFELDVRGEAGLFSYRLVVSPDSDVKKQRVEFERLLLDGKPLFTFKQGEVTLYHDDHSPGPEYSFDWSVSALATIVSKPDNTKLTWFKKWVERLVVVRLQPATMRSETEEESEWLSRDGS